MATSATAEAPVLDLLAWVLDEAVTYRQPDRDGCCQDGEPCGDHEADQQKASAMAALLDALTRAETDEDAIRMLRELAPAILAVLNADAGGVAGAEVAGVE